MRTSLIDGARRAYLGAVRGIFGKADDSKKMQLVSAKHLHDEQHPATERFQNYGFSSVPLPPDQDGKGAETIAVFLGGNRSHPVVVAVDDRRHRPRDNKAGEVVVFDDQGQTVHLTRGGIAIGGGSKKLPVTVTVGNAVLKVADGRISAQVGGDEGSAVIVTAAMAFLGGDPDHGGSFDFVSTVSGPSSNVKAKIG